MKLLSIIKIYGEIMSYFKWSDSMSVGVTLMDEDHKTIITLINLLHENIHSKKDTKNISSIINVLVNYTIFHFEREEKIMQSANYPNLELHQKKHASLKDEVRNIAELYDEGQNLDQDKLLTFLKDWLNNHILKEDMQYRTFCENNEEVTKLCDTMHALT